MGDIWSQIWPWLQSGYEYITVAINTGLMYLQGLWASFDLRHLWQPMIAWLLAFLPPPDPDGFVLQLTLTVVNFIGSIAHYVGIADYYVNVRTIFGGFLLVMGIEAALFLWWLLKWIRIALLFISFL